MAIYGSGEAAELAYLSLREFGLEPVAIFDSDSSRGFLGMPVRPIAEHREVAFDLMIIASLDHPAQQVADLVNDGIPSEKLFPLRRDLEPRQVAGTAKAGNGHHR